MCAVYKRHTHTQMLRIKQTPVVYKVLRKNKLRFLSVNSFHKWAVISKQIILLHFEDKRKVAKLSNSAQGLLVA